jgi:hypothetical protein
MQWRDDATPLGGTDYRAWPWWQARQWEASHLPISTISGREPPAAASGVARRAWVSAAAQQEDTVRQLRRCRRRAETTRRRDDAGRCGGGSSGARDGVGRARYAVPLGTRLAPRQVGVPGGGAAGAAHPPGSGAGDRDRVTLRALHGRRGALDWPTNTDPDPDPDINTETGAGLVDDVVAVRTTRAARIAGRCTRTRHTERIRAGGEQGVPCDSEEA